MIIEVANALGHEILRKTAFVGGVTTGLLLTDEFVIESVRATEDVDLIVDVIGYAKHIQFEEQLREKGFN